MIRDPSRGASATYEYNNYRRLVTDISLIGVPEVASSNLAVPTITIEHLRLSLAAAVLALWQKPLRKTRASRLLGFKHHQSLISLTATLEMAFLRR